MKRNADIIFGFAAAGTTVWLSYVSAALGVLTGIGSLVIVAIRLRKEWRHRDD